MAPGLPGCRRRDPRLPTDRNLPRAGGKPAAFRARAIGSRLRSRQGSAGGHGLAPGPAREPSRSSGCRRESWVPSQHPSSPRRTAAGPGAAPRRGLVVSTFASKGTEGDEGQGRALVIVSMRNKPSEMLLSHVVEKLWRDPQPRDTPCPGRMGPCSSPGSESGSESRSGMCSAQQGQLEGQILPAPGWRLCLKLAAASPKATGTCGSVLEAGRATATLPEPECKSRRTTGSFPSSPH